MICSVERKEIEAIRPTNILPQTPFWGRVKGSQGFTPGGFELTVSNKLPNSSFKTSTKSREDLLILIKYINSTQCYAYVPYGPKMEPDFEDHGVFLEELSETLRSYLPANCIFIRYDLLWQNQWAQEEEYFDRKGNWIGPPESNIQEFRVNFKTAKWNLRKSPVDILPKNTFFLDLNLKEDDLLYNMRYNTRYNVRRAGKKGIKVTEHGMEHMDEWYKLYVETAIRHNMPLQDEEYFSAILKNQDSRKNGVHVKMLMAEYEGRFLASMFLVLSNKRGTYLYGASSTYNQHSLASYALQWEAIKTAKKSGCSEYDMFGSAPNINQRHPLHGVHVYKKGFGGNLYHRMGCWDYPFLQNDYEMIKMQEMNN
ncbi:peptidoglycan bridge formation glycyltransferase FemA/FemB family protein [Maribellus comscasis]|uniref:Peptidoglycan bridge formation glycyltransferase FemA/FemB family protein n=1 Tax=Maribellus comscasis TaxID=2681766 RepID=A0A6I6JMR8_9BACT|nr:peptidoglycan bridge formation glycyltransferase FemA/FemB family protein [Maribellus comscasis]QGY42358.1 peptidoglycan bridge formation glycyltransferase FemA/FemB family protein [Maribellus comscasis]